MSNSTLGKYLASQLAELYVSLFADKDGNVGRLDGFNYYESTPPKIIVDEFSSAYMMNRVDARFYTPPVKQTPSKLFLKLMERL